MSAFDGFIYRNRESEVVRRYDKLPHGPFIPRLRRTPSGEASIGDAAKRGSSTSDQNARRAMQAIAAIGQALQEVIEGQCLDLELEGRVDTTLRMYLRMVAAKTGALLGASLEAGALMGGADAARAAHFRPAGRLPEMLRVRHEEVGGDTMTEKAAQRYAAKSMQVIAGSEIPKDALEEFEEVAYYVATRSR